MLRNIDYFGVEFAFRVEDYQKFKTVTGGTFFLIYLVGIFFYFAFGFYEYFYDGEYKTMYWDENYSKGNEINLADQEFKFGVLDLNGYLRDGHLEVKSYYKADDSKYEINRKDCSKDDFDNGQDFNFSNKYLICFDHKKNETLTVDSYNNKEIIYIINKGKNETKMDDYIIQGIYPINIIDGNNLEKILGMTEILLIPDITYKVQIILEKSVFIRDDGYFFAKNRTVFITNLLRSSVNNYKRKSNDDPLVIINIRQSNIVKVRYSKRSRLHSEFLKILSMATTLLSNFRAIVIILNLNKAKQNIFEDIFHINSYENKEKEKEKDENKKEEEQKGNPRELEIREIHKEFFKELKEKEKEKEKELVINKNIDNSERRHLSSSIRKVNELLPNKESFLFSEFHIKENEELRKKREKIQSVLMKKKKDRESRFSIKSEKINDDHNDINNDDLISNIPINEIEDESKLENNNENLIKEKMINIKKNYPTFGMSGNYENDPRFVKNFFDYFCLYIKCKKKRLNEVNKLKDILDKEFAKYMDIYTHVKERRKLEIIEDILFNPNEVVLRDYIALPLLNIDKEKKEDLNSFKLDDYEMVFKEYYEINKKQRKTDIERKLVQIFRNKVNES